MPTNTLVSDKLLAEGILRWERSAWNAFLGRFKPRMLHVAVRWCGPDCRGDCHGYGANVRYRPRVEIIRDVADDAFDFIMASIFKRLGSYRGECSLDTWLDLLLTPAKRPNGSVVYDYQKLFVDYLHHVQGHNSVPESVQHLSENHQKLYLHLAEGLDIDAAAQRLALPLIVVDRLHDDMLTRMQSESYGTYWRSLGGGFRARKAVSLEVIGADGDTKSLDPVDEAPSTETAVEAEILRSCLFGRISTLDPIDQATLSVRYDRTHGSGDLQAPLEVANIATVFTALGLRDCTQQSLYGRLRTLRTDLATHLRYSFGDGVGVTEQRIDGILHEWGTGAPQIAETILKKYNAR